MKAIIEGLADAIDFIGTDPAKAQARRGRPDRHDHRQGAEGRRSSRRRFANLTFTLDPIAASLQKSADDAVAVGLLDAGRPEGHLRPHPAQRGAEGTRRPGGDRAVTVARTAHRIGRPARAVAPRPAAVTLRQVSKRHGAGDAGGPRPRRRVAHGRAGRVPLPRRRVGLRQDHAAVPRRRARSADRRARSRSTAARR